MQEEGGCWWLIFNIRIHNTPESSVSFIMCVAVFTGVYFVMCVFQISKRGIQNFGFFFRIDNYC